MDVPRRGVTAAMARRTNVHLYNIRPRPRDRSVDGLRRIFRKVVLREKLAILATLTGVNGPDRPQPVRTIHRLLRLRLEHGAVRGSGLEREGPAAVVEVLRVVHREEQHVVALL